jgi:poly(3-hydroxybutyrate) depolymerase
MGKIFTTGALLLAAFLAACSGSSTDSATGGVPLGAPASYGDAPAQSTMSLDGLQSMLDLCTLESGTVLNWTDPTGEARNACLINPAGASAQHPLPLLVYLNPSLFSADKTAPLTGLVLDAASADLTGDAARKGFVLLMPEGRDTRHYYPAPDDTGIGWDNWYRNLDRNSPALNVDVAAIDHFISAVKGSGIVDSKRVYLSGWSNGAAMAQLYGLNTPGIAAAAVYSSPDPFSDVADPGAQTPFATALTPLMDVHNQCDIIGICQTGTKFHQTLTKLYPKLIQRPVIIDELFNEAQACDPACADQTLAPSGPSGALGAVGSVNHLRWPLSWNTQMYTFLREHPLP